MKIANKLIHISPKLRKTMILLLVISSFGMIPTYAQEKDKPKNDVIFDENHNILDENDKQKGIKASENEAAFTEGVKFYILGEFQKALDIFEKCKSDNKDSDDKDKATIYFKIAECYVRLGKFDKAISPAEKAINLYPKNQYYYWLLAETYKAKDDYKGAVKTYEKLIEVVPIEENFYFEMANCYLLQNKYEQAIKSYDDAEKKFGINETTVAQKQKIYLALNDVDNAINEGKKLIKAFPEEEDYWLAQAELLIDNQKYDDAEKILTSFLTSFPEDGHVYLLLSEVFIGKGDKIKQKEYLLKAFGNSSLTVDRKITVLNSYYKNLQTQEIRQTGLELAELVMKNHPENAKANQVYGDFLVANNRKREARDAYVSSLKYGKDNYKIWERIILFDFELQDYDAMLQHSEQVVELFPNQAVMWFYNGSAKLIKQKYEDAIISLEQARMFSSNNADLQIEIYSRLGDAYNATKDFPKSDNAYNKALELRPDNIEVLNNYSYYLSLRKEKLDLAKKMAARLVEITPNIALAESYLDTYGWVLFVSGEYENSKIQLEKAAKSTKNATILEHYGDVLFKIGQIDLAMEQWKKAKQIGGEVSDKLERKINERKLIE